MKIALVQQHATFDQADNVRRGAAAFEAAARGGAGLVAFAELAFLPFLPQVPVERLPSFRDYAQKVPGPLTEEFSALARRHGFRVAGFRRFERAISEEEIARIKTSAARRALASFRA